MPMTRPTAWALAVIGLAFGMPCVAQDIGVPGAPAAGSGDTLVPYLPGASYPHTIGPPRRGPIGRPRGFGRMFIEMDIVPSCTLIAETGRGTSVHCSNPLPYSSTISSDAGGDHADTSAFASVVEGQAGGQPVPVHAQRFTVDY